MCTNTVDFKPLWGQAAASNLETLEASSHHMIIKPEPPTPRTCAPTENPSAMPGLARPPPPLLRQWRLSRRNELCLSWMLYSESVLVGSNTVSYSSLESWRGGNCGPATAAGPRGREKKQREGLVWICTHTQGHSTHMLTGHGPYKTSTF